MKYSDRSDSLRSRLKIKVFIIIINYNGEKETKECLDSILKCNVANFTLHTVLVDNDPSHRIKLDTERYKKIDLHLKLSPRNLGFSGGANFGISKALKMGAEFVVILNNDTLVDKNFLISLLKNLREDDNAGIAVPKIYYAKGYEYHTNRYPTKDLGRIIWYAGGDVDRNTVYGLHYGVDEIDEGQFNTTEEIKTATGCCMMVKKEVFNKVGVFDDKFFLYYEDADFSERARKAGYKINFVPESIVWHKNAQSAGSGSDLQDYFITRNRLYFGLKYSPLKTKLHLIRESMSLLVSGRAWQKNGIRDYYLGIMKKGSY